MGFTAFRTEKSVSEEILRGEEAEVGGWEGVFGSGELRSFLGFWGSWLGFVLGELFDLVFGVVVCFRFLGGVMGLGRGS